MKRINGRYSAALAAVCCLLRAVPRFLSGTPRTPLRILCLVAFDTLHRQRFSRPLSQERLRVLSDLLDFGACANAALDNKCCNAGDYNRYRQRLENAGMGRLADDYVSRLRSLERQRPATGGGLSNFDAVRRYRESVVRLSLELIAATALRSEDESAPRSGSPFSLASELDILFRIVMQCQIIDDVIDHAHDVAAGLPGFLTASSSWEQSLAWTSQAVRDYSAMGGLPDSEREFPQRIALCLVTLLTKLVLHGAGTFTAIASRRPGDCRTEVPSPHFGGRLFSRRWHGQGQREPKAE